MSSGHARSSIAKRNEPQENAPSNSPANERPFAELPSAQTGKLVWLLAVLAFLFILNRNLRPSLAAFHPNRILNHWRFVKNAEEFDYLILNMHWPITFIKKRMQENKGVNIDRFRQHFQEYGYHFTIHGLWAGILQDPDLQFVTR